MLEKLQYYIHGQAQNLPSYVLEQAVLSAFSWMPTLLGIGARAIAYRLIMNMDGVSAIESNVRIAHAHNVHLANGVYLDYGVYLHATPNGISIGENTFIMHHSTLHVFNFRNLPNAKITIGKNCFLGEFNVIRGQGGVTIGDDVYTGPMVQIVAINHVFHDSNRPIREQGIIANGITIEDDVWLGAGVKVVDGVTIGKGSVIGAGSTVTKDIPAYSIAVGTPAKKVKDRRDMAGTDKINDIFFGKLEDLT